MKQAASETKSCRNVLIDDARDQVALGKEQTETTSGLKVVVKIIDKVFEKGRKYAADFKEKMSIQFDKFLPKLNYTSVPGGK